MATIAHSLIGSNIPRIVIFLLNVSNIGSEQAEDANRRKAND